MTRAAGKRSDLTPPEYFQRVAENSRRRWDQLDSDPELAGPWRQLFLQVQSPRHVVSELLQNADDAGAKFASARVEDEVFVFEHDGADFDESAFGSLCRFGYSNKRTLHTIGFRGIGFKSTFSLGDSVAVTTPSLSFRFDRARFTQPVWVPSERGTSLTRVAVRISTAEQKQQLEKNLADWKHNGASLLFFHNIDTLEVAGERVFRRVAAPGPVDGSEWIELGGSKASRVLLIKSEEVEFPDEAIREIKQERNSGDDFIIPPCRVEIVLGLPGEQRLYVVLPTGVRPPLPFSVNAPFIQDPSRFVIKDPSTSATNRWLLARAGRQAAEAMKAWLGNGDLDIAESVAAYGLLPSPPKESSDLAGECAKRASEPFREVFDGEGVLVTTDNTLSDDDGCIAPPPVLYDVWSPEELKRWLVEGGSGVLAREVNPGARQRLAAWGWLNQTGESEVLTLLAEGDPPPRPADSAKLLNLWAWAQGQYSWDYAGAKRRKLRIVPSTSSDHLYAADELVRLPSVSEALRPEDLAFLSSLIAGIDREWLTFLADSRARAGDKGVPRDLQAAMQMLGDIGLGTASPGDKVVAQAGRRLTEGAEEVAIADAVRLAHIAASLDARADGEFPFVTRGCKIAKPVDGLVQDVAARVEVLVPEAWADEHLLHEDYASDFTSCTRQQWFDWARSEKSGLRSLAAIREQQKATYSRSDVEKFVAGRGSRVLYGYPYVSGRFTITDHDFDPVLLSHWESVAKGDPSVWGKVVRLLAEDDHIDWDSCSQVRVRQKARVEERSVSCDPIPSGWLVRLRRLKCLPDTYNAPRNPAELLMRSPETEPLLGVEPFVSADLDKPHTKKLLSLLGVRDTPTDFDKLLGRIRDLATVKPVPVSEVARWFGALDKLVARSDAERVESISELFRNEPLVLTEDEQWAQSGEVFRSSGEEALPGLALLHPAVADLPLWSALGIADEPDDDLIVEWVGELPTGKVLDGGERARVRAFLTRCPLRIWDETGHWLALDGTWVEAEQFRFHLTRRADERISALFPKFKAVVADLSMVPRDQQHPALTSTAELNSLVEYRLSDQSRPDPARGEARPWLLALGQALARIVLKDAEQQVRVREAARRLARSVFHYQPDLRVIPYVEQAPAGETVTVRALWTGVSLLVSDRSPARYADPLIDELSRVFGQARVADAIRVCIDRDAGYVEEYVAENFELDAADREVAEQPIDADASEDQSSPSSPTSGADLPDMVAGGEDEDQTEAESASSLGDEEQDGYEEGREQEDEEDAATGTGAASGGGSNGDGAVPHHHSYVNSRSDSSPRVASDTRQLRASPAPREPGGPTFVTEFAKTKQFVWNKAGSTYIRPDGHSLCPATGPFQWEWRDNRQNIVRRIWFAEQRLDKGVEIDTQVWEAIKADPHRTSAVVIWDDGTPRSVAGEALIKMVDEKLVVIYPCTYRLRRAD